MSEKPERSKKTRRRKKIRNIFLLGSTAFLIVLLIPVWHIYCTLSTLKKVDDYPVYTLHYSGGYRGLTFFGEEIQELIASNLNRPGRPTIPDGGCTIFSALGDKSNPLVGRNFDWSYSPLLVLYTHPPGGYESMALVDLAYLGFDKTNTQVGTLPLSMALRLVASPLLVLEGLNEHGLAIAIAAVPKKTIPMAADRKTLHSCSIIRKILDRAKNTPEALEIISSCNPVFTPGPVVHYLIADIGGNSAIVEFTEKGIQILRNTQPWQAATNFYLAEDPQSSPPCTRFRRITQILEQHNGSLTPPQAMDALRQVSLNNTRWSVVYFLHQPQIQIALDRNYQNLLIFPLRPTK